MTRERREICIVNYASSLNPKFLACQTLLIFLSGSQNYKKSAVVDHAKNKNNEPLHPHTVAYKLFLETSKMSLETKSKLLATSGGQFGNTDVISSLKKIPPETLERLKKKFQTTYFTIKNEVPISACKNILKLESLHGVEIGIKHLNDMSLGSFIDYSGNDLKSKLTEKLCTAKWILLAEKMK